ncbi:MAG: hypothetical protein [Microviridae sp.]|nr:MAG: hypothetical protein [Microviridae sp.]
MEVKKNDFPIHKRADLVVSSKTRTLDLGRPRRLAKSKRQQNKLHSTKQPNSKKKKQKAEKQKAKRKKQFSKSATKLKTSTTKQKQKNKTRNWSPKPGSKHRP